MCGKDSGGKWPWVSLVRAEERTPAGRRRCPRLRWARPGEGDQGFQRNLLCSRKLEGKVFKVWERGVIMGRSRDKARADLRSKVKVHTAKGRFHGIKSARRPIMPCPTDAHK